MKRETLIAYRHKNHWTQVHAAHLLEVDRATLQRWEQGISTPHAYQIPHICTVYGATSMELGLDTPIDTKVVIVSPERDRCIDAFVHDDLTMRVLSLAFLPRQRFQDVQKSLTAILEEFDMVNTNDALVTRREALRRLATFPVIATGAESLLQSSQYCPTDAIHHYAASIAACWELSRDSNEADITLAFRGASAYLPVLKALMKDAPKQRKEAANLAAQCAKLQTVLGWHLTGLSYAIQSGLDAIEYSNEAGDISLQLSTYNSLAWAYHYSHRDKEAMQQMNQAALLLKQHKESLPPYTQSHYYSCLAVMQAKNGQSYMDMIRRAEKTALSDADRPIYVDPPIAQFITNAGAALYEAGDHDGAMTLFHQLIEPTTLRRTHLLAERTYVEVLNMMALATLKRKNKDLDYTLHLWDAAMQGTRHLQSEQRFREAHLAFEMMEAIWPDEQRIKERQKQALHW